MNCIICNKILESRKFNTDQNSSSTGDRLIFRLYEIFKEEVTGSLCSVCHTLLEEYDNYQYCLQGTASQVILRRKCHEVKGNNSLDNLKDLASENQKDTQIERDVAQIPIKMSNKVDKHNQCGRDSQSSNDKKSRMKRENRGGNDNVYGSNRSVEFVDMCEEDESNSISYDVISRLSGESCKDSEAEHLMTKSSFTTPAKEKDFISSLSTETDNACEEVLFRIRADNQLCFPTSFDHPEMEPDTEKILECDEQEENVEEPTEYEKQYDSQTAEERRKEEENNFDIQNNDEEILFNEPELVLMKIGSAFKTYQVFLQALEKYYSKPGLGAGYK